MCAASPAARSASPVVCRALLTVGSTAVTALLPVDPRGRRQRRPGGAAPLEPRVDGAAEGRLATEPVPPEELRRAQRRHRIQLDFSLDSAADLVGWWGTGEVVAGPESFEHRCRRVDAVTPADVLRVARATFTRSRLVAVAVGAVPRRERAAIERLLGAAEALPEG